MGGYGETPNQIAKQNQQRNTHKKDALQHKMTSNWSKMIKQKQTYHTQTHTLKQTKLETVRLLKPTQQQPTTQACSGLSHRTDIPPELHFHNTTQSLQVTHKKQCSILAIPIIHRVN